MCTSSLIFIDFDNDISENNIIEMEYNAPVIETYDNYIKIYQENLNLDHEVIQYKILFHENDTITFNSYVSYILTDNKPVAYFILLTDGETNIISPTLLFHVPIGGKIRYKLLNFGSEKQNEVSHIVKEGECWYLTLAIYDSKSEQFEVTFESVNDSMELIELTRHSKLGLYSVWKKGDFSGLYLGRGLMIAPYGISLALDVTKTINLENGVIVFYQNVGQIKGTMEVNTPMGNYVNRRIPVSEFLYFGNNTGTWEFKTSGIGFPFKQVIFLFYIDIDPHMNMANFSKIINEKNNLLNMLGYTQTSRL